MEKMKVAILRWMVGLCALLLCGVAWGQPAPVTQAQACNHWGEPIRLTLRHGHEMPVGLLVAIVAEDLPPAVAQAILLAYEEHRLRPQDIQRLASREGPRHASSVAGLVSSIYTGGDDNVRGALEREIIATLRRAGRNRVKFHETYTFCPRVGANGRIEREPTPLGWYCPDGTPSRRTSRTRLLREGDLSGNFYEDSFPIGEDCRSWNGFDGHSLTVFIKPARGAEDYQFTIGRAYNATNHPRPGAQLCAYLPTLAGDSPPGDADSKAAVFDRISALTASAITEGDLLAAGWAVTFASTINMRLANLDALRASEAREATARAERDAARRNEVKARGEGRAANAKVVTTFRGFSGGSFLLMCVVGIAFYRWRRRIKKEAGDAVEKAAGQLNDKYFEGVQFGQNTVWNAIKNNLATLVELAKVNASTDTPEAKRLRAVDMRKDWLAQVRETPDSFMADLCAVLKSAVSGTACNMVSNTAEEQEKLRAEARTKDKLIERLKEIANAVTSLVFSINMLCKGTSITLRDYASIDQITKARDGLIEIVATVFKATKLAYAEDGSLAVTNMTNEMVMRQVETEPVGPLVQRLLQGVTSLQERISRSAESLKRAQTALPAAVKMLMAVRTHITIIHDGLNDEDPLKRPMTVVLEEIRQGHTQLAQAARERISSSGLFLVGAPATNEGGSKEGGK